MDVLLTFDNLGEAFDLLRFGHAGGGVADGVYANRHGTPRILDMLARLNLRATFFIEGWSARKYAAMVQDIAAAGHEIGAHGWLHEEWHLLQPDDERELINRTTGTLGDVLGAAPIGWRAPYARTTPRTLGFLVDEGYRYDSSFNDSDVPYRLQVAASDDRTIVELPFVQTLNDTPYYAFPGTLRSPEEVGRIWWGELVALRKAAGYAVITAHPRHSGRPARIAELEQLITRLQDGELGATRFLRCQDAADEYGQRDDLPTYSAPVMLVEG